MARLLGFFALLFFICLHPIEATPELTEDEYMITWNYLKRISAGDQPVLDVLRDIGTLTNIIAQVVKGTISKPIDSYKDVDPMCQAKEKYYYRTHDGTCNWLKDGNLGKVGQPFGRDGKPHFEDGYNEPRKGPNPRELSNIFFNNTKQGTKHWEHTAWLIGYVEFLVHDLLLSNSGHDAGDKYDIPIPKGDSFFDPKETGDKKFEFWRTKKIPGTGVPGKPRASQNDQSIWIDMATIYGNSAEVNRKLRTGEDGKLKLDYSEDPDGLLPMNDATFDLPQIWWKDKWDTFAAGDIRANQDFIIQAFHTVFAREHNRLCDLLKDKLPDRGWDDETLFLAAKTLVGSKFSMVGAAYFQSYFTDMPFPQTPLSIYSQYTGTGPVSPIQAYPWKPMLNPKTGAPDPLPEEFSVGYRWHDLITAVLNDTEKNEFVDVVGTSWSAKEFKKYGYDKIIKMISDTSIPDFRSGVQDAYRNLKFSFRDPEEGRLFDLATWAIEHERERGCPTFNEWVDWYPGKVSVKRRKTWKDFTSNKEFQRELERLYKDVDKVDMWVGQELDEEWWPHTHIPRALLAISFYTLFKGSVIDRFALIYQIGHCLLEQKPWACEPWNIIQEVLWREHTFLGQKFKWLDLFWLDEFDARGSGNNMLRQIISQNTRDKKLKCLQKNLFFLPDPENNPITCWDLSVIPGPKHGNIAVLPMIGQMKPYLDMAEKYGDVVHYSIMGMEFVLLSRINDFAAIFDNPEFWAHQSIPYQDRSYGRLAGYKNDEKGSAISNERGWAWERHRWIFDTKIAPDFHTKLPLINEYARELIKVMEKNVGKRRYGPYWDIHKAYFDLTGILAFSKDWVADPKVNKKLWEAYRIWEYGFPETLVRIRLNHHLDYSHDWMAKLMKKKKESKNYGDDWFGLFASTVTQDGTKLTDQEVYATTYDSFAGNVGGPFQLTYGLWLLGKFPEVADKIAEEVNRVLKDSNEITLGHLHQLPYLNNAVKEMFRYFPGGGFYGGGRINPNNSQVVETYLIPVGTTFLTNSWKIHHDPRYYKDPEDFNPDRWINFPEKLKYAFQTFGAGRRECAGKKLVEYQTAVNVAHIVKNFHIKIHSQDPPKVKMTVFSQFQDDEGPDFTFTRREKKKAGPAGKEDL